MHALAGWENFFVITGSSAAALTGLVFIVITLVAGQERIQRNMRDGVETFSSPTVAHFCAALLISAILSAPWQSVTGPAVLLGLTGIYGVTYAARIMRLISRANWQQLYEPDFQDWLWYAVVPLLAYALTFASAVVLTVEQHQALFGLAAGTILLIFVGIRNAWDTVTFIAVLEPPEASRASAPDDKKTPALR